MLTIDNYAPDFSLPSTNGKRFSLNHLMGKNIILYFYPKDFTSGCTLQGKDFAEHYKKFVSLNTVIVGVSRDTLKSHLKFKLEQQLPYELLADVNQVVSELYEVLREKKIYGKIIRGIERSTFLIDNKGLLRFEWRKVKVPGHVKEVLITLGNLDLD